MKEPSRNSLFNLGAVLAAVGASACCLWPVAVAVLGVGSAALGAQLEPLRPYLVGLTVALLGLAFYRTYRPGRTPCLPDGSCAVPESRRRQRIVLWLVAAAALALIGFPYYVTWLL